MKNKYIQGAKDRYVMLNYWGEMLRVERKFFGLETNKSYGKRLAEKQAEFDAWKEERGL